MLKNIFHKISETKLGTAFENGWKQVEKRMQNIKTIVHGSKKKTMCSHHTSSFAAEVSTLSSYWTKRTQVARGRGRGDSSDSQQPHKKLREPPHSPKKHQSPPPPTRHATQGFPNANPTRILKHNTAHTVASSSTSFSKTCRPEDCTEFIP